jgi:predicted homoserine dehydrogenase-like protein
MRSHADSTVTKSVEDEQKDRISCFIRPAKGEYMSLHTLLAQRIEASGPIKVGVIGAGKFASMFLTQALNLTGIHMVGVADLAPDRARAALARTGWPEERYAAASFDEALKTGGTHVTDSPIAGAYHAVRSIDAGCHVIMVTFFATHASDR